MNYRSCECCLARYSTGKDYGDKWTEGIFSQMLNSIDPVEKKGLCEMCNPSHVSYIKGHILPRGAVANWYRHWLYRIICVYSYIRYGEHKTTQSHLHIYTGFWDKIDKQTKSPYTYKWYSKLESFGEFNRKYKPHE